MALYESTAVFLTAASIGILHGVEPGHGWPVAAVFALNHRRRWWYGIWSAVILAVAHLISSFAVVAAYALADHYFNIHEFRWMHLIAGGLLLIMAIHQWRARGHHHHGETSDHTHRPTDTRERLAAGSLLGLVGFAFALGFVHVEEFAIIALAAGKANPWVVMGLYAVAVGLSIILLTILAIATLNRFEKKLGPYEKHLPRISAIILGIMGLAYVFQLI